MGIKEKKVKISLEKSEPTKLTTSSLKKQLNNIGLTCEHTSEENLKKYKEEVLNKIPQGVIQTFGICKHKESTDGSPFYKSEFGDGNASYFGLTEASKGNWEPSDTALGYSADLEYIQYPTHFDYLMENRPSFTGKKSIPFSQKDKVYSTVTGIKNTFTKVGTEASLLLVKGLDKASIESLLSDVIAPITDETAKDYNPGPDSRVVFLVDNYNPSTGEADGIGVLSINWKLTIKDYKEKKKVTGHETSLEVTARAVIYDSIDALEADVAFVESHFKNKAFCLSIPPKPHKLEIFDTLPAECNSTFNKGLPVISKEKYVEVIILYAPNVQNIGCMDNSQSDAESKYSKSVTSGFTFSTTQTLSGEFSFEAGIKKVFEGKIGFKLQATISFTEQWNTSQTETIEFTVPGGKKAFLYQGYLEAAVLRFDAEEGTYKYVDKAKFISNIIKTSNVPIIE